MDVTQLLEPVLTHGIRNTNFFNGRVLTAEDLRTEQEANRAQHRQLARALGEGVAYGLEVTRADPQDGVPVLRIMAGLGFNRDGDAVALRQTVGVRLVSKEADVPPQAGLFTVCVPPARAIELTNVGLYVLTVRPASALSPERAPMTELDSEGIAAGCGSRWAVEGVRFAVAPLPLAPAGETPTPLASELGTLVGQVEADVELVRRGGASDTPQVRSRLRRNLSLLRNGAAYICFGADTEAARRAGSLPTGPSFPLPASGAVEGMRERGELASCELPLALFNLSKRGIEWVDTWAVRRPVVPALQAGTLGVLPGARAEAEALSMVLQFQQHVAEWIASDASTSELKLLNATEIFRFLPPVGLLPLPQPPQVRGFDQTTFFQGIASGVPIRSSGSTLRRLLADALLHAPLDLASDAAVQLWRVVDDAGQPAPTSPPYVVFTTRHGFEPRVHVQGAQPEVLQNGAELRSDVLARGIHVEYGQAIDPLAATSAACFVTVDLPFPGNEADRAVFGNALIGFQPVVLAGRVEADGLGGLSWFPDPATAALLRRGLPLPARRRTARPFSEEWEVFDPTGSPASTWGYTDEELVEQLSPGAGAGLPTADGLGSVAVSKRRVQENAFAVELGASVPSYGGNTPRALGLVFNFLDARNYHVLICRYHWVPVGFSGAFARTSVQLMRVLNGQPLVLRILDLVGAGSSTPRDIGLAIKQQGSSLLFSARATLYSGFEAGPVTFAVTGAPARLEAEAGVGLMTRYTAPVQFTRLEVIYPDAAGKAVLVPPLESQRTLARLTLKRNFLQGGATEDPALPSSQLSRATATSQTDFERWFWLVNPPTVYGYGYGYGYGYAGAGIGAGLI